MELLPADNRMKQEIITKIRELMQDYNTIRDVLEKPVQLESDISGAVKPMRWSCRMGL